ncbi:MAG: TatD family hydrolase [Treponema sp.]|nr:TatD family hydrolase [Treponema sp.]
MKLFYCDSHIHLSHCKNSGFINGDEYFCVSSCHTKSEFEYTQNLAGNNQNNLNHNNILSSFGIHPQIFSQNYSVRDFFSDLEFLKSLLFENKIAAVGEFGFDFFAPEFKATSQKQAEAFEEQILLSQKYGKPVILHIRKAVEKVFAYSKELKKLPSVIFHSFPGTVMEAKSILNHGVNAYFSFGKPILNGKKSALECVKLLPPDNLLFETDAPYQTLKNEKETLPLDIKRVYQKAAEIRESQIEELSPLIFENFKKAFLL